MRGSSFPGTYGSAVLVGAVTGGLAARAQGAGPAAVGVPPGGMGLVDPSGEVTAIAAAGAQENIAEIP